MGRRTAETLPDTEKGVSMAIVKRMLCLASSRKGNGRCVAGREVLETGPGPWIRPVTNQDRGLSEDDRRYPDDSDPQVLDIIDVPLIRHQPHGCQTEN